MILYILNFVLCSGLLLLVYRTFLGYENLYRFNRFYLLFSLVFSLIVPFITIRVQHIKVPLLNQQIISQRVAAVINSPVHQQVTDQPAISGPVHAVTVPIHQQAVSQSIPAVTISPVHQQVLQTSRHNYFLDLLAIYIIITLVMLGRLAFNGYKIGRLVAKNTIIPYQGIKLVLLDEAVTPHSFLKYVFINKSDYQIGLIEPEIICHEQTHVKQLHSLDIIAVELLRAVCWFNPFISFYRRAMQLNHEFLADEAVVKSYDNTPAYQYLLLSKAGHCGSLYLTSQFNYLVTKKRLLMMTKNTSDKIALYKRLAIIPVFAVIILLFSHKAGALNAHAMIKTNGKITVIIKDTSRAIPIKYDQPIRFAEKDAPQRIISEYQDILKKSNLPYKKGDQINLTPEFSAAEREQLKALYIQMSRKQQLQQYVRVVPKFAVPVPSIYHSPTAQQLVTWQDARNYSAWVNNKLIKNVELAKYKASDLNINGVYRAHYFKKSGTKNPGNVVSLWTKKYYTDYLKQMRASTAYSMTQWGKGHELLVMDNW